MPDSTPPNILRFQPAGSDETSIGTEVSGVVTDLPATYRAFLAGGADPVRGVRALPTEMRAFIAGGDDFLAAAAAAVEWTGAGLRYDLSQVRVLTPVPDPGSIIMFGRIYQGHIDIGDYQQPPHPNFFMKGRNCLVGPDDAVILPDVWDRYTYGTELCLVFGRGGRGATEADAMSWVYGYTISNDITARGELQHKNKMFDTFAPIGPYIVPRARVSNPQELVMRMHVDGELTQEGSTAWALWPLPRLIKDLTEVMTVELGDLASTGDVGTVHLVQPGQVLEASIEGIGTLRNHTVASHEEAAESNRRRDLAAGRS